MHTYTDIYIYLHILIYIYIASPATHPPDARMHPIISTQRDRKGPHFGGADFAENIYANYLCIKSVD